MKRKLLGILLLSLICLGGCGSVETVEELPVKSETEIGWELITEEQETKEQQETESQPEKIKETEDIQKEMTAEKLTGKNEKNISIDYSIDSYKVLQEFSRDLFGYNIDEKNPVLSPVSAYMALALAGSGAKGETKTAFFETMGDLEAIPNDLMLGLPRDAEKMQICLANSAWVDHRLTPNAEWLAWADSVYKSEVFQTQLSAQNTYMDINAWINEKTKGLIQKMFEEPLSDEARLLLINTLYFKGMWANSFEADNTRKEIFTLADGSEEEVDMMNMSREHLLYVKDENAEGVILPYADESMAFLALKPVEGMSVREMYNQLTIESLNDLLDQEETTLCNLKLPKFKVVFSKKLNDSLINMGLGIAFDDKCADFSGIGTVQDGPGMYIDAVQQKAVIIVDEEGTEAAAATVVVLNRLTSAEKPEMPIPIYFDEPFLYMIVDRERNVPLFVGIMDNPNV